MRIDRGRAIAKERRVRDLEATMLSVAAIGAAAALEAWIVDGRFMPIYSSMPLLCLACVAISWRGRYREAVLLAAIGFAGLMAYSLFDGHSSDYGGSFAFIPAVALFCLYFGGPASLLPVSAASLAYFAAWYLLSPDRAIGLEDALSIAAFSALSLALSFFVGQDLRYVLLDKDAILAELQHRVRNTLQILLSLASRHGPEGPASAARLRAQVAALRHVQDQVGASGDFRTIDMGPPIRALIVDVRRGAAAGAGVTASVEGSLPAEKAGPIVLILAELLVSEASGLLEGEALVTRLTTEGGRGFLSVEAFDGEGEPRRVAASPGESAAALLRQVEAGPSSRGSPLGWSVEFDASPGPSFLEAREDPLFGGRKGTRAPWSPLLGRANRGRSGSRLRRIRSLIYLSLLSMAIFSFLAIESAARGGQPRYAAIAGVLVTLLALACLRTGRLRLAVSVMTALQASLYFLAAFEEPGANYGVMLFAAPVFFLFCLHFIGGKAGIVATVWSAAFYGSWFALVPRRDLPLDSFIVVVAGLAVFIVMGFVLIRNYGRDLGVKESLAFALERRLRDDLALLAASLDSRGPSSATGGFDDRVRAMARANTLVSREPDIREIDMRRALESMTDSTNLRRGPRDPVLELSASGCLTAEKASPALLLAVELYHRARAAESRGGRLILEFRAVEERAVLRAEMRDAGGRPVAIPLAEDRVLRMLEAQVAGSRGIGADGSYTLSFAS